MLKSGSAKYCLLTVCWFCIQDTAWLERFVHVVSQNRAAIIWPEMGNSYFGWSAIHHAPKIQTLPMRKAAPHDKRLSAQFLHLLPWCCYSVLYPRWLFYSSCSEAKKARCCKLELHCVYICRQPYNIMCGTGCRDLSAHIFASRQHRCRRAVYPCTSIVCFVFLGRVPSADRFLVSECHGSTSMCSNSA